MQLQYRYFSALATQEQALTCTGGVATTQHARNTIEIHIYEFAAYEIFVAMLACSCTVAAAHIASRSRQALPSRKPSKNLAQHKFIIKNQIVLATS